MTDHVLYFILISTGLLAGFSGILLIASDYGSKKLTEPVRLILFMLCINTIMKAVQDLMVISEGLLEIKPYLMPIVLATIFLRTAIVFTVVWVLRSHYRTESEKQGYSVLAKDLSPFNRAPATRNNTVNIGG